MVEAARIPGSFAAILLIVALAAWTRLIRGPEWQRLDGRSAPTSGGLETALPLLAWAAALSAGAAGLAIAGWVSPQLKDARA